MPSFNITSAGISAVEDRDRRIRVYFIMMAIRLACVLSLIWVRGWWILLVALGAVFLPYLAVVIANEPDNRASKDVETPEPLQITSSVAANSVSEPESPKLIVVEESEQDLRKDDAT